MTDVVTLPHYLRTYLSTEDLNHLAKNVNNYGPVSDNIKVFMSNLLDYVIRTPTPKRYLLCEFYIILKLRQAVFLTKQHKTIIDNYGRAFLYLKTGRSEYHDTELMNKVIEDNMNDALSNNFINNVPVVSITIPLESQSLSKRLKETGSITLEDILLKRLQLFRSATLRNIEFNLDDDDVRIILERKTCYYTGARFKDNTDYHRTVDRIDNKLGYVKGNVVACTLGANKIKNFILEDTRDGKFVLTINQLKKMAGKL